MSAGGRRRLAEAAALEARHPASPWLWRADWAARRIEDGSRTERGMCLAIPVAFALAHDAVPTDSRNARDQILWRLAVAASVPGVDFESAFEVPVFRTADSDRPRTDAGAIEVEPPAEYRQPPGSRIQVTTNRRGIEILFPAARNPGAAAGATLFLVLWCGVVAGAAVALGGGGAVARGVAGDGRIGRGGPGERVRLAFARAPLAGVGDRRGRAAYRDAGGRRSLLRPGPGRTDGRKVAAGRGIRDKREAEWLAATLERAVRPR